jgi:hypothetical protein
LFSLVGLGESFGLFLLDLYLFLLVEANSHFFAGLRLHGEVVDVIVEKAGDLIETIRGESVDLVRETDVVLVVKRRLDVSLH